MQDVCNHLFCTGCGACVNVCGKSAITMCEDDEGFLYPNINQQLCVNCGICKKVCPENKTIHANAAQFYMAWHRDDEVLKKSSSGGAFTAIADYVLKRNGVVFGAAKDPNTWEVYHIAVDSVQNLDKLRLSKYYQSNTKKVYLQVKQILMQNRYVLFSGTTCQIAGLYSALEQWRIDPNVIRGASTSRRLITADVLCHGCTSKNAVVCYIKSKEKKYKKEILNFHFRAKTKDVGWYGGGGTRMKLEFADGTYRVEDKGKDTFFVGFNNFLFLRESCYKCRYCGTDRISDFTLADFWGIDYRKVTNKQMYLGVSVMCVNTDMAKEMLSELSETLHMEKINSNEAVPYNRAFTCSGYRPKARESIFDKLEHHDFDFVIKQIYWRYYLKLFVKQIIINCIGEKMYRKIAAQIKAQLGRAA